MNWYRWDGNDLYLNLRVTPRARQDQVDGLHDGYLRIRLRAPPVDDKANTALCRWLAQAFAVSRAEVNITQGARARGKLIKISGPRAAPAWFTAQGGIWLTIPR